MHKMTTKEKVGAAFVLAIIWGSAFWPMVEALADNGFTEAGLTYDEANNTCGWVAAADNVACYVLPDGDLWKATTNHP